jgi:hypothetical protein
MTNDECPMTTEALNPKADDRIGFADVWHLSFLRHSLFGIRHWFTKDE